MRFVDPDLTTTTEIRGVTFTAGFWPPRESARFGAEIEALRRMEDKTSDEYRERALDLYRGMVGYGIRGWSGWEGAPAPVLVEEEIGGRKHRRLDARMLDGVSLSGVLEELALACLRHNNLTPEESKSDPPSGSPPP